jgi:hypothetical protein
VQTYIPYAIHVTEDESLVTWLTEQAQSRDARLIHLPLEQVHDLAGLESLILGALGPPHRTVGFDAIVDLMSDLDWLPSKSGYVVHATGLDGSAPEVRRMFAGLLPDIVDRWRSRTISFVAVLRAGTSRTEVVEVLRDTNASLAEFGRLPSAIPGTYAVPVYIDGVLDIEPTS